jgi:hypothetical protein
MAKKPTRVLDTWEPEGILQQMGHHTMDPFEFGDSRGMNTAEKAANMARFMAIQRIFGGLGHIGRMVWNKRMGPGKSAEWMEKHAAKRHKRKADADMFWQDPATGEWHLKDEHWGEGDNPYVGYPTGGEPYSPLSGQFSEDPLFDGLEPLSGQTTEDPSFLSDPLSGEYSSDPSFTEDPLAGQYSTQEPYDPNQTWSGMDPYTEMAVSPSYGTGERLMKEPTIQDIINSMEDPRSKAAAFDQLRNPFESPELAEAFAPGADVSIERPFDPRGRFDAGSLLDRMGAMDRMFGGGGGGGMGGDSIIQKY